MGSLPILFSLALLLAQVQGTRVELSTRLCSAYLSTKLFHPRQGETHTRDHYWFSARHSGGTYARASAKALINLVVKQKPLCEVYEQPTGTALLITSSKKYHGDWKGFLDTAILDSKLEPFDQGEIVGVEIFGVVGSKESPKNYAVLFLTTTIQLQFLKAMHNLFPFNLSIPAMVEGFEQRRKVIKTGTIPESKFKIVQCKITDRQNRVKPTENVPYNESVQNPHTEKLNLEQNVANLVLQGSIAIGRKRAQDWEILAVNEITEIVAFIEKNCDLYTSQLSASASSVRSIPSPSPQNLDLPALGVVYWEHDGKLHIQIIFDKKKVELFDLDRITTGDFLKAALLKLGEKKWFPSANANFADKERYPASKFASFQATECLHSAGLLSNQDFHYIPGIVVAIRSKSPIERPMDDAMMLEMINDLFDPSGMTDLKSVEIYGAAVDFCEDLHTAEAFMTVVIIRENKLLTHIYALDPSILISAKAVRVAVEAFDRFNVKSINGNVTTFDLPIYTLSRMLQIQDDASISNVAVLAHRELLSAKSGNIKKKIQLFSFGHQKNLKKAAVTEWKAYAFSSWFEVNNKLILAKVFDDVAQNFETLEVLTNSYKK